ncbi:MAG: formate dehydrogenase subunit gamma [Betaproteobacteria bacterium]|nr:formate dehydrogenase subunit gamma [Betaproteobacteria bacterium]MDH3436784.1 formate dehydrogenase subunit gamma [Betaproteobacteria bacterium]
MGKLAQLLGALTIAIALVASAPAGAQQAQSSSGGTQAQRQDSQPLNNAPVWRDVRSGSPGFTNVQGVETGVLVQSGGETWRQVRVPIAFWGGILVAAGVLGLALFYFIRGALPAGDTPSGRLIRRFSPADRHAHWLLAITWVILAITGLILSLGKSVLLPVLGYSVFAWLASMSKTLHNFTGPILIVAIPWLFIRFVRNNGIGVDDFKWFLHIFDFLFKGHQYPSHRFNAGEKVQFWIVLIILSTVLLVSGLIVLFPNFGQGRGIMQISNAIHMVSAYVAIALSLVHIYLGTLGVKGAYSGMRHGYVDETWAKHHHEYWYQDVVAGKAQETFAKPGEGPPEEARQPGKMRTA